MRFIGIIAGLLAASASGAQDTARTVHTLTGRFRSHPAFRSRFLTANRDILVYLPPEYESEPLRRFPVLYMHDGQNLFDGATSFIPGQEWRMDETAETLIRARAIQPLIIVGIYNTGRERINEYTPIADPKYHAGGAADLYGRMLVEELKPFIDRQYRTKRGAGDTGLGGSSLGGLVSLYLGMTYPRVFGRLAILSPSAWWDDSYIIKRVEAAEAGARWAGQRIWLDTGTAEGDGQVESCRKLRDALIARGLKPGRDLRYMEDQGAKHNEAAWSHRVEPMLRFLFPPSGRPGTAELDDPMRGEVGSRHCAAHGGC